MLSTLKFARPTIRRLAAAQKQAAAFHTAAPLFEEKKDATEDNKDISPAGIDRSNPLYAPSWRREWKHYGYTNIAEPEDGKYWTEWKDLPAPYKYYHVKVDPADVESHGTLWKLATNWKTAIPLSLGLAIPLFVNDIIVVDSHVELAAIFWTCVAMVQINFGGAIRNALSEENDEIKKDLYNAEAEYFEALEDNIDTHKKAIDLPLYVRMLNEGERQLRHVEAAAATRKVAIQETNRMIEMLEYLAMTSGSDKADAGDNMVVSALRSAEQKIGEDKQTQQQTITDAISALKASGEPQTGNATEKAFENAIQSYIANPPKQDPAKEQAEREHERDIFNKRFGFVDTQVTESMLEKAQENEAAMAVLTAKVGGQKPQLGMKLLSPNPFQYTQSS